MHPELIQSAELSLAAYGDMAGHVAHEFENRLTSTTFYWKECEDRDFICFKGSAEAKDIFVDLLAFPPVYYLKNWVHPGFALSHKSVQKKILKIFKKIKFNRGKKAKRLICTGHSLGAAQAELTHLMALQQGIDSTLICFGKPRVFLKKPRERFPKGSALSVCSGSDIVTRVPRFCYTVGSSNQDFLYLANDKNNYLNPDPEFVESDFSIKDAVSDHSMELYLQRSREVV